MADAREEILGRIRQQLGSSLTPPAQYVARIYGAIPRDYKRTASLLVDAKIDLLLERLRDYDADVFEIPASAIAVAVAEVLERKRESILLVPSALPETWLPAGVEVLRDLSDPSDALPLEVLTRAEAVLTPCAGAIAETGTILLQHGAEQGRRSMTLLPDHHICVLRRDQIVETVSEGFALFDHAGGQPLTTISGPSATADIEMTRIRGVHGPRRLTVLLIDATTT